MSPRERPHIRDGVMYVDGRPHPFSCTDYHYFRDDVANWPDRLRAQRDAGMDVLSFYVPWRHHAPEDPVRGAGAYDFTGRTQANRDVVGLIDLAEEEGLSVVLKPGPFVHAELPYGGLPGYVCPDVNAAVEPERDAHDVPYVWSLARMRPESVHPLPAPFGEAYNVYVRDWLGAVARTLMADRFAPDGPVIGVQLLNEGIYSESASALPTQLGFAPSTLARYHAFLRERYGTVRDYNRSHGLDVASWEDVDPPREAGLLASRRDILRYMDWSAFQSRLYVQIARLYKEYLVEGGMPADAPVIFNFNPNGGTFRTMPASNDGWYTRVNVREDPDFAFGITNWVGIAAGDPETLRQFVMAATASRGPAMELNWGFISLYEPPFKYVVPSHFETMVALACGATGFTAYTFSGTRAWRNDPDMQGEWIPRRTNTRGDETAGDYPGEAPILSDGERRPEYWTLQQLAQYRAAESPRFLEAGPFTRVAWAIYPPYAWAGQWLPRGDADDPLWRPPLRAVPRGAYHGLDAFVEMMLRVGAGFGQVDVEHDPIPPDVRVLCTSGNEYMDAGTQERLARFVEAGGSLVLTTLVPTMDERLDPLEGALATRLFPHRDLRTLDIVGTRPVTMEGDVVGLAQEVAVVVEPPPDADHFAYLGEEVVGYRRRVGEGAVYYLGFNAWRARYSGDDAVIARRNQDLLWRLVRAVAGGDPTPAEPAEGWRGIVAWQHGDPEVDEQEVHVIAQDPTDPGGRAGPQHLRVRFTRPGGVHAFLDVTSPSQVVHVVAVAEGRVRSCYLKGVNDLRAEAVAPSVSVGDSEVAADAPCDLCVTADADGGGLTVTVAHVQGDVVHVRLPVRADDVDAVTSTRGDTANVDAVEGGVRLALRDVRDVGAYRVPLRRTVASRSA